MSVKGKSLHLDKSIALQVDQKTFEAIQNASSARLQSASSWIRQTVLDRLLAQGALPPVREHYRATDGVEAA